MSKADDLLNQWTNITLSTEKFELKEVQQFLDELKSYIRSEDFMNLGDDEKQFSLNQILRDAKYMIRDMSLKSDDLLHRWTNIVINNKKVSIEEVQHLVDDLKSFMLSDEYKNLGDDEKHTELNYILLAAKYKMNNMNQSAGISGPEGEPGIAALEEQEHDPRARELLDRAESAFYAGSYKEAVELYDLVLKIEQTYPRALEHRKLAEEYARAGILPAIAYPADAAFAVNSQGKTHMGYYETAIILPPDAAMAFSRAQEAAWEGRNLAAYFGGFERAMQFLETAKNILEKYGILRWKEGLDFAMKLEEYISAEEAVKDGQAKFNQGQINDALEIIEHAAQFSEIQRHKDIADKYRRFKNSLQQIQTILYSGTTDPKLIMQALRLLEELMNEFGANPALERLRTQLEVVKPRVAEHLREDIRRLISNAERAIALETARSYAREAEQTLILARDFDIHDEGMYRFQNEITRLMQYLNNFIQQLQQAEMVYSLHSKWPSDAYKLSQKVRACYPQDEHVIELTKKLAPYRRNTLILRLVLILVVVGILRLLALYFLKI